MSRLYFARVHLQTGEILCHGHTAKPWEPGEPGNGELLIETDGSITAKTHRWEGRWVEKPKPPPQKKERFTRGVVTLSDLPHLVRAVAALYALQGLDPAPEFRELCRRFDD